MSTSTEQTREVPAWIHDMEFCHVQEDATGRAYCGHIAESWDCGWYDDKAICDSCGCPTCPRCAQLSALAEALDDA